MNEFNNNDYINDPALTNTDASQPEETSPDAEPEHTASAGYSYSVPETQVSGEYHYASPDAGRSFDSASGSASQSADHGSYYSPYISKEAPVYSHDFTEKAPKQKKARESKGRGHGWLVALCILLSLASGFGGAWTYSKFFSKSQVVINTVAEQPSDGNNAVSTAADITEIISTARESVVEITTETMTTGNFFTQSISKGAGSGVIFTSDGYIVTCYHVIENASVITVTLNDGTAYRATVYGYDAKNDIAVIRIEVSGLTAASFADSSKLKVGESVFAIGNPLGSLGGSVTDGIVSALDREVVVEGQEMILLQTSAAVNHGNSGGGLFNAKGELIGIVNAKSAGEDVEGLGFAIPSNIVIDTVTAIVNNESQSETTSNSVIMGVMVQDIYDEETASQYGLSRYGVYILSVDEGFGADKAGLMPKDCIVSVDNIAVAHVADLLELLKDREAGDVVSVQVVRGNRLMTFDVELMPRNS